MKNREEEIKNKEQIEKLIENMASPFEIENIQEVFNGIRFEVIDVNINKNGDFYGLVMCHGFPFCFEAHVENGHANIDSIESIELPHNDNFNSEKAKREFAKLDMFSWEAQ